MKKLFTLIASVLIASTAMAEEMTITSAEIVSGKTGSVELATNAYGSQAVATSSTWYTFAKSGINFEGARICVATEANGGGIQVQGNASDAAKQGFIGNTTGFNKIESIELTVRVLSTNTNDPAFHLYVGSAAHPTTGAVEATPTQTEADGFRKYVYSFAVTEGKYFEIKNDLVGALYIDQIKISGDLGAAAPATEYTVNVNVTGQDAAKGEQWMVAYMTESSEDPIDLALGANTIPAANTGLGVMAITEDANREVTVKVNNTTVTLSDCQWMSEGAISANTTIDIIFSDKVQLPTLNDVNTIANIIACYDNGVVTDKQEVKVTGYISNMFLKPADLDKYHDINIWLTDTPNGEAKEFELYNCFSIDGANFATIGDGSIDMTSTTNTDFTTASDVNGVTINVGDLVVAIGQITKYNGTYEFARGCKLVSVSNSSIEGVKSQTIKNGKRIENGKVYIYSNGVRYNILGQVE